jgi:Na+-transporting NADH:ubiquinone oxidoreductase subunit A
MLMDCNMHGEERACINCGTCASVCPVDILPQFTMKCVLADEVEESLEHGLLDCAECGLCSYVCPSKIEICTILKEAKAEYYKEQMSV